MNVTHRILNGFVLTLSWFYFSFIANAPFAQHFQRSVIYA